MVLFQRPKSKARTHPATRLDRLSKNVAPRAGFSPVTTTRSILMTFSRRFLVACLALAVGLTFPVPARAADPAPAQTLDLVPEDAAVAVAVRSVAELRERGDKLAKDSGATLDGWRPSMLFNELFKRLGVEKGVDEKGAAAIVIPNVKRLGIESKEIDLALLTALEPNIVFIIPIDKLADVAAACDLKVEDLKDSKIVPLKGEKFRREPVVAVRGKHLYYSHREKAIKLVFDTKPLSGELTKPQRETMAKSDLFLLFGPRVWGELGNHMLKNLHQELRRGSDKDDHETVDQFFGAIESVRFLLVSLNVEEGLGVNLIAAFPPGKNGDNATKFLSALRAGAGASDLNGLPMVEPWMAYAAKGDGTRNAYMARALIKMVLSRWLGIQVVLPEAERKQFVAAFEKMYLHLRGSRAVIYPTDEKVTDKIGTMAGIVILDVDDAEKTLAALPALVEVANAAALKAANGDPKKALKFSYKPRAESIDGARVEWLTLEIPSDEDVRDPKKLLGPDWNKWRLAVHGKQLVLLIGSDTARLKETLANLKTGAKGLADHKPVAAALSRLIAERKLEYHISVKSLEAYQNGKRVKDASVISFALGVEPEHLQLEVRATAADARAVLGLLGIR